MRTKTTILNAFALAAFALCLFACKKSTPPTVTISNNISVTQTSANVTGEVTNEGSSSVTERGFIYGKQGESRQDTMYCGSGLGEFPTRLTGLEPNTTYNCSAFAKNDGGIGTSGKVTFTTRDHDLPIVTTSEVENVGTTTASCGGNVMDDGGAEVTERGVCWSTNHSPVATGSHATSGSGLGVFACNMNNLAANTTYYVRAYAKNVKGVAYGEEKSFTTLDKPTVSTASVTNIGNTTATGGGNVISNGGATVTERGICWSTSHNPTISGSHANSGTGTGEFMVSMTNLTPNTTYYVRAYAINSQGTAYGEEVNFKTSQTPTYTIAVSANPSGSGSVTGGGTYEQGQSCTVTATAATGYNFQKWTENGSQVSTNATYTFTVSANRNLVAVFQAGSYTISASASPSSGGTVSGAGSYNYGQNCTLTATPATGYSFVKWTKNGTQVSTNASYTFAVTASGSYVAHFQANSYTISVSASPSSGGTVSGGGTYTYGQSCTVHATANNGYTFFNWTENGNVVSTNANYIFTVNGNRSLVAHFRELPQAPTGAINGLFSVSATHRVWFSQGNLQYKASTNTWRFATNQYDYIGNANSNISSSYSGWIDLFGWGTSGWNCGNTYYSPWNSNTSCPECYGPYGQNNLTGNYANSDWGYYNTISNGGNTTHKWRTLTREELAYVFNTRSTSSGIRYAKAKVNNVNGVILLPDDWNTSYYSLSSTNNSAASFSSNVISASNWTNSLQSRGAVFLPVTGNRSGTSVYNEGYGFYWSASCNSSDGAWSVRFDDSAFVAGQWGNRMTGRSVRLVCPAE